MWSDLSLGGHLRIPTSCVISKKTEGSNVLNGTFPLRIVESVIGPKGGFFFSWPIRRETKVGINFSSPWGSGRHRHRTREMEALTMVMGHVCHLRMGHSREVTGYVIVLAVITSCQLAHLSRGLWTQASYP